jgi:hypothetical protein
MNLFEVVAYGEGSFDSTKVLRKAELAFNTPLGKIGSFIWQRARTSLRRPRRLRISELTPARQRIFESRSRSAEQHGDRLPTLPYASSKPGEPPRTPTGRLRDSIMFSVDEQQHSTVIGPIKLNGSSHAPTVLEFGGTEPFHGHQVDIKARPFMQPALMAEINAMPQLFEGVFK